MNFKKEIKISAKTWKLVKFILNKVLKIQPDNNDEYDITNIIFTTIILITMIVSIIKMLMI